MWEEAIIVEDYISGQAQLIVKTKTLDEPKTIGIESNEDLPPISHPKDNFFDTKSNLTSLHVLHEASILDALRRRFEQRCTYNYCGIVMVVLNPYVYLPASGNDQILNYRRASVDQLEPHVFSAAEKVYRRLERFVIPKFISIVRCE